MAIPPRRRYLLIPVLYVAVILGLFSLALFGRGFSHAIGEARLSGKYSALPLFGSREVRTVALSYNGLSLGFSRGTPLRIGAPQTGGQAGEPRGLRSIELSGTGADILFEKNTRLHLAAAGDGSLILTADVPASSTAQSGLGGAPLSIPYRVRGTTRRTEGAPVLSWTRRGKGFLLTLPPDSRIDEATGTLVIALGSAAGAQALHMAHAAESSQSPLAAWLSEEASRVSEDDLRQALVGFTDAAYQGWSGPRLSAGGAAWKLPGGPEAFDERIACALLSESLPRGTYQRLRPVMAEALAQQLRGASAAALTATTSAYVGNLREYTRRVAAASPAEVERIRGLLARSDASLLETARLIPFSLDHGPFSLVQDVFTFASRRDPRALSLPSALGLLECLLDYSSFVERSEAAPLQCRAVIEARLLPSVRKTDAGVFLESAAAGAVDMRQSVRCGALLLRAGEEMDMALIAAIGRSLLVSSLAMAKDWGVLPARLTLAAGRISTREGALAPEDIYAQLPLDRPRAREIPLYGSLGPGSWILTAAQSVSVENSPASARITLAFPAGLPHYAAIQGIASFSQLTLHGTPWRPAADYAQYSDGYAYDSQDQTLYVKLTGRAEKEEILISW